MLRPLTAFATIVRESRLLHDRDRSELDETSDVAWLVAAVPIAAFLAWLVVVAQR
jgi:hypothetical protein